MKSAKYHSMTPEEVDDFLSYQIFYTDKEREILDLIFVRKMKQSDAGKEIGLCQKTVMLAVYGALKKYRVRKSLPVLDPFKMMEDLQEANFTRRQARVLKDYYFTANGRHSMIKAGFSGKSTSIAWLLTKLEKADVDPTYYVVLKGLYDNCPPSVWQLAKPDADEANPLPLSAE